MKGPSMVFSLGFYQPLAIEGYSFIAIER